MATKVTLTSVFKCYAPEVFAALTDPAVLAEVMAESESLDPLVEVHSRSGHVEIHIRRGFEQQWPALVSSFIGERLQIEEERRWQQTSENSWEGVLQLRSPGLPIEVTANLRLFDTGAGSELEISGLVRCSVPLIGGKVERLAADLVEDAFHHESEVAARHCA